MQITLADLLGPFALTVGLILLVGVLLREHLRSDRRTEALLDRSLAVNEKLVADGEGRRRAADREA